MKKILDISLRQAQATYEKAAARLIKVRTRVQKTCTHSTIHYRHSLTRGSGYWSTYVPAGCICAVCGMHWEDPNQVGLPFYPDDDSGRKFIQYRNEDEFREATIWAYNFPITISDYLTKREARDRQTTKR